MCLIKEVTIKLIILGDSTLARLGKNEWICQSIIVEVNTIYKGGREEKSANKPKPRVKIAQLTLYSGAKQGTGN